MIYERVTFVEAECVKMTEKEFIDHHIDTCWPDRDKKTRRRMLADAHRRMKAAVGGDTAGE